MQYVIVACRVNSHIRILDNPAIEATMFERATELGQLFKDWTILLQAGKP
jgi:hypothetical protein